MFRIEQRILIKWANFIRLIKLIDLTGLNFTSINRLNIKIVTDTFVIKRKRNTKQRCLRGNKKISITFIYSKR
jgi:hypothetical protein